MTEGRPGGRSWTVADTDGDGFISPEGFWSGGRCGIARVWNDLSFPRSRPSPKLWDEFVRGKGNLSHQLICATASC